MIAGGLGLRPPERFRTLAPMDRKPALALALAPLLSAAPSALAQAPPPSDVSGFWELQTSVFLGQTEGLPDCQYAGSADITQDGNDLGGDAGLDLESGDPSCPSQMSADVDGEIIGNTIQMGLLIGGGNLGTAQWTGTVNPAADGITGGDFVVESGPFSGAFGTWSAERGVPPVPAIPALTKTGAVLLVVVLLGAAALLLRSRRPADQP